MTKHTPGPWKVVDLRHQKIRTMRVHSQGIPFNHVATIPAANYTPEADARLIAAAPDMLEALREVAAAAGVDHVSDRMDHALRVARAAIAKATEGTR